MDLQISVRGAAKMPLALEWLEKRVIITIVMPLSSHALTYELPDTQDIDNEEARSKERLAAMADRSKSQLDETQDRVAALAAQGLSSIEEQRSSGLSKLAALAEQQPKPVRAQAQKS